MLFNLIFNFNFFETGFLCVALPVLELSVDSASLRLRDLLASASKVLGLKDCVTTLFFNFILCQDVLVLVF